MASAGEPQKQRSADGGVPDVAAWATASAVAGRISELGDQFSQAATEAAVRATEQAQRLLSIEQAGDTLDKVVQRWGGQGFEQFAGHIFEWHHTATFNANAAAQSSPLHSLITEFPDRTGFVSNPHAPVDVGVVDQSGNWIVEAQAKVLSGTSQRLRVLAQDKYESLRLLVPTDHKAATDSLIERRRSGASPGFLKQEAYESVRERLTDHLSAGDVQSDAISEEQLHAVARDPLGHLREWQQREERIRAAELDEQARNEQLEQWMPLASIAGAAFAGGAAAAAMTAFVRSITQLAAVRSGELTPSAAAMTAASDATAAFARGALVGAGGQSIAVLSQELNLPVALGGGTLPFAMARAGLALGETTIAFARGEIKGAEAAQRSANSVARISVGWAGSLIGQVMIPIPVVGAFIGGTVASLNCALASQAMAVISAEMREARQAEELLAVAQVELAATLIVLEEQLKLIDRIAQDWDIAFATHVLPSLNTLERTVPAGHALESLDAITQVIRTYQGAPLFTTLFEFDEWMRSDEQLVLRTNPPK